MRSLKLYLLLLELFFSSTFAERDLYRPMTDDELFAMRDLAKIQCMHNIQVSGDIPNSIKNGNFSPDRNVKCYIDCIFDHLHIAAKGALLSERAVRHAYAQLPKQQQDEYVVGVESCQGVGAGIEDKCDFAYELAKCLHQKNVIVFV